MLSTLLDVQTQDNDPLTLRRGRSLALLLLLLMGISALLGTASLLTGQAAGASIASAIAISLLW